MIKPTKECKACKKVFEKKITCSRKEWGKARYCSRSCINLGRPSKKKGVPTGKPAWNKGMTGICFNTGRTHIKKGQHLAPHTEFKKGLIPWSAGKKLPYMTGPLNNKWKGGITSLVQQIRHCPEMKVWKLAIFKRDNYTCVLCGRYRKTGDRVMLEADHYPRGFALIIEENKIKTLIEAIQCKELWNLANGRTLCRQCHLKMPNHGRSL